MTGSRPLRFLFPAGRYTSARISLFLLAQRLLFGGLLLRHGIGKISGFATLSAQFPDPLGLGSRTSLLLAIFAEVFCSAAFMAGMLYRLALLPMIFSMGVALLAAHAGDPFAAKELALIYLAVFLLMFAAGPGRYALDRIAARRLGD